MRLVDRSWLSDHIYKEMTKPQGFGRPSYSLKYVILSHRWGKEEVDFADLSQEDAINGKENSRKKLGGFFVAARVAGYRFVWFDSGCINKSNGPEVDESIRSMFSWYRNADTCFVYLHNTTVLRDTHNDEWFKRGWTLQELLAPQRLLFFNRNWVRLSRNVQVADIDRRNPSCYELTMSLGIKEAEDDPDWMLQQFNPQADHAAQIFACMARRSTTRPEDMAYGLISLLDVHMPIAYGEGAGHAFYRLQLACAQESVSRAIFCWELRSSDFSQPPKLTNSMLASAPSAFESTHSNGWSISFDFPGSVQFDDSFTFSNVQFRLQCG
ncbi:hypothetical protein ONZ45_g7540 [Pleurotus djamor]|nr:hypothetical protein ONZ45_g7540 [Pleurotus djamor]